MSYDVDVSFSSWPKDVLRAWSDELSRMGMKVVFHPKFDPLALQGWLPIEVEITGEPEDVAELPFGDELYELGSFDNGFEYYASPTGALFVAKGFAGNAVAVWCAAALAAIAKGSLYDLQFGLKASGATGDEVLAKLAESKDFVASLCGPES